MRRLFTLLTLGALLVAVHSFAGVPPPRPGQSTVESKGLEEQQEITRVDPWQLLQSDGQELFQHMCASCHGAEGIGTGSAPSQSKPAPALTNLEAAGIPRTHWVYVLESPCEDPHHWGPSRSPAMPCWQRIFRQALGNDAAPMLVSTKLAAYIDSIQQPSY